VARLACAEIGSNLAEVGCNWHTQVEIEVGELPQVVDRDQNQRHLLGIQVETVISI